MKRYILLLMLTIAGFLYSCSDDFLDVVPMNQLSDGTFWKTADDAYMGLMGVYNLWGQVTEQRNIWVLDDGTDNAYDSYWGYNKLADGSLTPASAQESFFWTYTRIRRCNNFLAKIEKTVMDETTKNQYKAEVRFLRAYDYFRKIMFYGDVPLVTELYGPDHKMEKTPVTEIQKFVLDELEAISNILPVQNNVTSKGRVQAGSALALKARLELFLGKYADAMVDAKKVIDMNVFALDKWPDKFKKGNFGNKEAIFTINFADNFLNTEFIVMQVPRSYGGYRVLNPTWDLVETFETLDGKTIDNPTSGYDRDHPFINRDPRMTYTLLFPGATNWPLSYGKYYNTLDRFLPNGKTNPDFIAGLESLVIMVQKNVIPDFNILTNRQLQGMNIMVIRLAEMYITYAEAALQTNQNLDIALNYLNMVRQKAGMPPAGALTMDLVRRERRVEFAFEGLRYYDIKRWDIGSTALNGPVYSTRPGTINMETGEITWTSDQHMQIYSDAVFVPARKYLMPIPQSEIDVSGMIQNDGY